MLHVWIVVRIGSGVRIPLPAALKLAIARGTDVDLPSYMYVLPLSIIEGLRAPLPPSRMRLVLMLRIPCIV